VARKIVTGRRTTTIRNASDLRKLGAIVERAAGFLAINGRRLAHERWKEQLTLWRAEDDVGARAGVYEFSPGTFR
jgi:predicted DNA-binding helix-hairpin-helix protein